MINCYRKELYIDKKYEFIKVVFSIYLFILIGKLIFPMYSYINLDNRSIPEFSLIQLNELSVNFYGIIKFMIYFIPLGLFLPILFKKYRNLKNCIVLGIVIFILNSIFTIIKGMLGINFINIISIESLIISLIGISIGFYIFKFKSSLDNKKTSI